MAQVIDECTRTWRRLGVPRPVAEELTAELEADLAAAGADGQPASTVVGDDPRAFATAWATGRGVVRPRPRLALTAAAALVGALPGVCCALFVAYGLSSEAMAGLLGGTSGPYGYEPLSLPSWLLLALYGVGALVAYAGAVGAVAAVLHWRGDLAVSDTVRELAAALPAAVAAAIGATVLLASQRGFSTGTTAVLGEVLVAATVLALSVAAVRLRTVRRERARLVAQQA